MTALPNVAPKKVPPQASERGERLYPRRWQRLYWHLTCLRKEIERTIENFVASRHGGTLVDYGCGNMPYRRLFEPHVDRYLGCDMPGSSEADVELTPSGLLPFADHSARLVLSSQVLEHVADPAAYLAECRRVLEPGGRLILSTHGVWKYHPDPTDYWRWTSAGLTRTISQADFTVLSSRGIMAPPSYALQILQDALHERTPRWLRTPLSILFQPMIEFADRLCSQRWRDRDACVFIVVAE